MRPFTDFVKHIDTDLQRIALHDYLKSFNTSPITLGELIEIFQNGGAWEAVEKLCRVSVKDLIVDMPAWWPKERSAQARTRPTTKSRKPMSARQLANTPAARHILTWVKQHPNSNPQQIRSGVPVSRGYWQQLVAALVATRRLTRTRIGTTNVYTIP